VFGTMLLGPLLAAAVVAADQERGPARPGAVPSGAQELIPNRRIGPFADPGNQPSATPGADPAQPPAESATRSSKPFA